MDDVTRGDQYQLQRDNQKRWVAIKDHIGSGVFLDVGSNYGYFSDRIASLDKKNNLVWSVESNPENAEVHKDWAKKSSLQNVVITNHRLTLIDLLKLSRTVEGIDTILALSVLHYYEASEIPEVVYLFSRIAPRLIIEFPNQNEKNVAHPETIHKVNMIKLLEFFYEKVSVVGHSPSPKDPGVNREIFVCENPYLEKSDLTSYIRGEYRRTHSLIYSDGSWEMDEAKELETGLNLSNLLFFNPIYPSGDELIDMAVESYQAVSGDCRLWNVVVTPAGVKIIDFQEEPFEELGDNKKDHLIKWWDYINERY